MTSVDNQCNIILSGKNELNKANKHCSKKQCENIEKLALFLSKNPEFLNLTHEIFLLCYKSPFEKSTYDLIISKEKKNYSSKKLSVYEKLILNFYSDSMQIDNDRGKVLEKLCENAIQEKYKGTKDKTIKYHSKVNIHYEEIKFSTEPYDIDVCGKDSQNGDFLESKRSLEAKDKHLQKKLSKLSALKKHFDTSNKKFSLSNNMYIFAFTNNPTKLNFYKTTWPDMSFLGITEFKLKYI